MAFRKHYPPLSKTVYLYRSPSPKLKPRTQAEAPNPWSPSPAPRKRGFPLPLWRGVNGLANYRLITASQTIITLSQTIITLSQTIVGRWPPCPVLQQEARVFTPLSNGEGLGVGLSLQRGGGSRVAAGGRGFWPPCHNHWKIITINTKHGIIKQEKGLKTLNCVNCFGALHINTYLCTAFENTHAEIAQLVEHNLAKVGVAGSSPVFRSSYIIFM